MALSKYIKQPVTQSRLQQYLDNELQKIQLSLNSLVPTEVIKSQDVGITNSVTLVADSNLRIGLTQGYWSIDLLVQLLSPSQSLSVQHALSYSGAFTDVPPANGHQFVGSPIRLYDSAAPLPGAVGSSFVTLGVLTSISFRGVVNVSNTGILQFHWAPNNLTANTVYLKAGSFMLARGIL